jgi:hypothetical protein
MVVGVLATSVTIETDESRVCEKKEKVDDSQIGKESSNKIDLKRVRSATYNSFPSTWFSGEQVVHVGDSPPKHSPI